MFNNSSHVDASHSTFNEVHRDQFSNVRSTVQGNQTVSTIIHGNQIVQDSQTNLIDALRKVSAASAAHDSAQRYPAPKCIEGTRIELLARLSSWVDEPDEKPICWLNGRPGSGKSAVSQTIAEKYANEHRLAASFFFSRRDLERRTTQHVIPTLATQLLAFLPSIRPAIVAALEKDYMIPMKVLREQTEKLLLEPLSTATETHDRPILIILDALDECDEENLVSELVTLVALLPQKMSSLRLLITSRSEPWIQSQFAQPDISALTLSLEIHSFSAEADIRSFLRHALDDAYRQHLQVMRHLPRPWPPTEELERIVNKTGGLFIFALTVAKFIGDKMHHPVERLQAILEDKVTESSGSAYADLDSLYRDAISVFPDPDIARLVLGAVYCMAIPMSVAGLHKLLQRPDVDARIIVPALSSVLLASEDGKQPIQFYHASFRDFLVNPQRSQKFVINPDAYHRFMAQLCFETMSNSLKRDICGIGDPSKANDEVADLAERRQAVFDEALLYSCRFWSRHLAQLPGDGVANDALLSALNRFSTTVLLCWIEALSLFGELESAVVMLRDGVRWLRTLREIPKDALTLLEDAERLVVLYMDCISQCALHVYLTALSFVPTDSAIYKTFKHQSLGALTLHPGPSDNWTAVRRSINLRTAISSVAFSPNGDSIATAGVKQGVQVWNTITGGNIASLGDRSSTSLLVSFSPSGAFLAAAFEDGTVAVWDPKVGREHLRHEGCHTEPITCIGFSPNGTLLASGSRDRAIQIWSMETAQALYRLATHEGPVTSIVFSSDSQRLFSGSEDKLIIIWDMSNGKVVRGMMGHRKTVNCVAVSKDGQLLASGSEDKTVKLWDTSSGKCTQTYSKDHHSGIRSIHLFDDDKRLVIVFDEVIVSWNNITNKQEVIWSAEDFLKKSLKRIPAWESRLLGGAPNSMLRLIISETYDESTPRSIIASYAILSSSFVFTHRGYLFAGALPNPVTGIPVSASGTITTAVISSDGNWAATADPLGSLQIIDLNVPQWTWDELESAIKSSPLRSAEKMIPSPTDTRFVLHALLQWYLVDGDYRIVKKIDVGVLSVMRGENEIRFKFSADGRIFFCVMSSRFSADRSSVRVFDAATGEQRTHFAGLKKVHSFISSADGAWIACCHGSGVVEVFGVVGGGRTSMRVSDDVLINVLVFSENAELLVGGSKTGVVRVWDRASGECKTTFEASTSMVTALAHRVTPGGAQVAIGRADGSISVWSPSASASHDILRSDQVTVKNVDIVRFDDQSVLKSRGEDGTVFTWALPDTDDANMAHCARCSLQDSDAADDAANTVSLPHLLSQSDPEDAPDSLFHTLYRVRKDGWLVNGERRLVRFGPSMRPRGKDVLYAYENGLVAFFTPSTSLVFLKWAE